MKFIYFFLLLFTLLFYNLSSIYSQLSVQTIAIALFVISLISISTFISKFRKVRILSFEILFFSIFIIVTYFYPIFFYRQIPHPMFSTINDTNVIKSIFIASSGIFSYLFGASINFKKINTHNIELFKYFYKFNEFAKVLFLLTTVFIIIYFITGGAILIIRYSRHVSASELFIANSILFYVKILLLISTVSEFARLKTLSINSFKLFFSKINKLYLLNISVFFLFLLIAGDRGTLIELLLPFLFLYHLLIKTFSLKKIVLFLFTIGMLFVIIKDTRQLEGGVLNFQNYKFLNDFTLLNSVDDFLPASADLYILVDQADSKGFSYGKQAIPKVLGIIPFLQSITSFLLDIDFSKNEFMGTSDFVTFSVWSDKRSGLGTNIVGDLYYSFGWIGVIIFFIFFGGFISFLDNKIFKSNNLRFMYLFLYSFFIGISIYFVRSEFAYPLQFLSFSLITIWFISKIVPIKLRLKNIKV